MRQVVVERLRKRGVVVGLSGGIDSSVCAALSVRAFGAEHVLGVLMPESDSADETLELSRLSADEPRASRRCSRTSPPILEAAGCYTRRDAAIRSVLPEYGPGWKAKIVLPSLLGADRYRLFKVVARVAGRRAARGAADGRAPTARSSPSTNFKQRTRKMLEYHHADRLDYAVVGTPNRLEYDQGFFVKQGDGAADVKPIAHLYKTQVYAIAEFLDVPEDDPHAAADDRHLLAAAEPGGVLLLAPVGQDGSLPLRASRRACRPRPSPTRSGSSAEDVERVYKDIDAQAPPRGSAPSRTAAGRRRAELEQH